MYVLTLSRQMKHFSDLQMGQGSGRVARNQQLQQQYSEQFFPPGGTESGAGGWGPHWLNPLQQQHRTQRARCPPPTQPPAARPQGKRGPGFIDLEMMPPELASQSSPTWMLPTCAWPLAVAGLGEWWVPVAGVSDGFSFHINLEYLL